MSTGFDSRAMMGLLRGLVIMAVVFVGVLGLLFAGAGSAAAQTPGTCVDDVTGVRNNCTANDVSFGEISVLSGPSECIEGEVITVTLRARLIAGANERYDIGLFLAQDGGNARNGSCFRDFLRPVSESAIYSPTSGVGPFYNGELADTADICGDLQQNVLTTYDLQPFSLVCRDADNNGFLDIGAVISWDNQNSNTCRGANDAVPNTKSKCRAVPALEIPISVPGGALDITKTPVTPTVNAGQSVAFTIRLTNTVPSGTVETALLTDTLPAGITWSISTANTDSVSRENCQIVSPTPGVQQLRCDYVNTMTNRNDRDTQTRFIRIVGVSSVAHCPRISNRVDATWVSVTRSQNVTTRTPQQSFALTDINVLCSTIEVDKVTIPPGAEQPFDFALWQGERILQTFSLTDTSPVFVSQPLTPSLTYSVTETPVAGWTLVSQSCTEGYQPGSITPQGDATVTCTFTNQRQTGTIVINKMAVGGDATFDFTGPGGGLGDSFQITTSDGSDQATFSSVPTGVYTVSEGAFPAGWDFGSLVCNGNATVNGATATINVGNNETVTCTYTNVRRGSLTVTKIVDANGFDPNQPPLVDQEYEIRVEGVDVTFSQTNTLLASETWTLDNLLPGQYRVEELAPTPGDGWLITIVPVTPTVVAGQNTAVEVRNMPLQGELLIVKTVNPEFVREYAWAITKTVDPPSLDLFVGDSGEFTYTLEVVRTTMLDRDFRVTGGVQISNPSTLPVLINQPVDVLSQGDAVTLNCLVASWPYRIEAGEALNCNYNHPLSQDPAAGETITNTVTVSLTNGVVYSQNAPFVFDAPTTKIDNEVTLEDDLLGLSETVSGSTTRTYPGSATCDSFANWRNGGNSGGYDIVNTATLSGTLTSEADSATVRVNCYRLGVSKTAETSYVLTTTWDIAKTVDQPEVDLFNGDSQSVTYIVTVTNTGAISGSWRVDGTISISNPAPLTANIAAINDILNESYPGVVSNCAPGGDSIAPNSEITCDYVIDLSDAGAVDGENVARIALVNTPSGSTIFSGTQAVNFGGATVTETNTEANVTDSYEGDLGSFTGDGERTYSRSLACPIQEEYVDGSAWTVIGNTATINETGQSDAADVLLTCYRPAVTKTANTAFTRTYNWTVEKDVDTARLDLFDGETATVTYTVNVVKSDPVDSAFRVNGVISIFNPHPTQAATFSVQDVLPGGLVAQVTCGAGGSTVTVDPDQTATCTYTASPSGVISGDNVVTATMQTDSGSRSYIGPAAVIFGAPTTVIDDQVGISDTNPAFGEPVTTSSSFNREYQVTYGCEEVDFSEGTTFFEQQINTVTVDKTVDASDTATVDLNCYLPTVAKTAQGAYGEVFDWTLVKSADPAQLDLFEGESQVVTYTIDVVKTLSAQQGFAVNGSIVISNPNPARNLPLATVVDQLNTGQVLPNNCPTTVPAGQNLTCTYGGAVEGVNASSIVTNVATITTPFQRSYASASQTVSFADVTPSTLNDNVTIVDSQTAETWPMSDSRTISYALTKGCADITFEGDSTVYNNTLVNTASVRELTGRFSTAEVDLSCYRLAVSKDTNESFTRQYFWDIEKTVDQNAWDLFAGDQISSTYTVTAFIISQQDNNWQVDGTITISNPAPMPANVISVVDMLPNGVPAAVSCPNGVTVPANSTANCTYSGLPGGAISGDNIVTATLQTSAGSSQYVGAAPVAFGDPTTEIDKTASVVDNPYGPLGTFTDGQSKSYEMGFACENVVYGEGETSRVYTIDNIASIVGTETSDSETVTVTCWKPPVIKTANTRYNRVYDYDIVKTAEPAEQTIYYTDTATFAYTLQVTKFVREENNFAVGGAIVINNPAPIDATLTSIEDILPGAENMTIDCTPDNEAPYTVQAGSSLNCTYSADLPDRTFRINEARATMSNGTVLSATAPVDFNNAVVTPINDSAPISDSYWSEVQTVFTDTVITYSQEFTCQGLTYNEETGFFSGAFTNVAQVLLEGGDTDSATVTLHCYQLGLSVQKTATPTERPEPGGIFTFTVVAANNSPVPVTLTSIADDIYGDLTQVGGRILDTTCALPQNPLPANGGQYGCSFTAGFAGQPGATETDTVTVTGIDSEGTPVEASDSATIRITDVPSSITLTKTADKNVLTWPGGDVIFTVQMQNTSAVDAVQINTLTDSIYGNITQVGGKVLATTCSVPLVLTPNAIFSCTFTVNLTLAAEVEANLVETNVVTATGADDDGQPVQASDDETVTVLAAQLAVIGDRVFIDIDPGGRTSAEQLAGNQQQDFDANGQPIETNVAGIDILLFTADGVLVAQTKTGEDGFYRFDDVPPGEYYIVFVNNGVFMGAWTGHNAAIADDVDSDVDPSVPLDEAVEAIIDNLLGEGASLDAARTPTFTVEPGQTYLDIDAGLVDLSGASSVDINGIVWLDANRDGIRQPDESTRIPGVIVELYRVTDGQPNQITKVDQMTTDGDGFYEFLGLDAGIYFVKVIIPPVYQITEQNAGDDSAIDNDVNPITGESELLVLSIETVVIDAGVYQTPTALEPIEEPALMSNWLYLPTVQR